MVSHNEVHNHNVFLSITVTFIGGTERSPFGATHSDMQSEISGVVQESAFVHVVYITASRSLSQYSGGEVQKTCKQKHVIEISMFQSMFQKYIVKFILFDKMVGWQ
jgi:hypothetical protein